MNRRDTETGSGTQPFDAPDSLVGRTLEGRYRLDETLATGGMGILFEARQFSSERSVVVKMLRPSLSDDLDATNRFEREIEVLSRLSHPNIVSLIDSGRDAGGLRYLVMEYIEGEPFDVVLQQSTASLNDLLEIFIDLSSALAEAHDRQIVHRDLWFDNVVLARQADGRFGVTVLDFGVAKPLDADAQWDVTKSGEVPGTPAIVAPELVEGAAPTPAADLYSFGVLTYTALTGEQPFEGENEFELMRAHQREPVPDPVSHVSDRVPEGWLKLTRELLAKEPSQRPEGAARVRARLESLRSELGAPAADEPYVPNTPMEDDTSGFDSGATVRDLRGPRGPVQRLIRAIFGEKPIRAPLSVVIYLSLILIIQICVIVYLIFG
jgi:serine/threonine-protein kinase